MYSSKRSISNTVCGNIGLMLKRSAAVLLMLIMTAATAWADSKPVMYIDECYAGAGYIHAKGWAYDPDNQDYSLDVFFCIFTDANLSQLADRHVIKTNIARTDVNQLQGIPGNHGFEADIPIDADNYWVGFVAYNRHNTEETTRAPYPVTVLDPQTVTVTLTSESGPVTLGDGAVLTGTGGANTHVSIASGATVTLSGVNITSITEDRKHDWAGITCMGDATIILAEGTDNAVKSGDTFFPGIQVGPPGSTLTIRGNGSLNAQPGGSCFAAGIGSPLIYGIYNYGNILIEGGNIAAYSVVGAAIGGTSLSSCGTITITGGNVYAENWSEGPGIGCTQSTCAGITITGGTVTAKSYYGPGLGSANGGNCNYITISGGTITAETSTADCSIGVKTERYDINPAYECTCGPITIGGVVVDGIKARKFVYNSETTINYVHFEKNDGGATGTMANQVFFSTTAQQLNACAFSLTENTCVGWNTAPNGSGTSYSNEETITVTAGMTLYAQWVPNTYYDVSFNKNATDATGSMSNQTFIAIVPKALTANAFTRTGYVFTGWNTEPDGSGAHYADGATVSNLGDVTLYAQWQIITYSITYNMDGGTNGRGNPASYTIQSDAITLAEPVRVGYDFAGWTFDGQNDPIKNVTIGHGSHGDRAYTAHWTFNSIITITPEMGDVLLYNGHILTGTGGANTHVIIKDGATVTLSDATITGIYDDVSHMWAGITCEGNAVIVLASGTTNNIKGGLGSYPGISIPKDKTLTIQGNGTLYLSSNGYGPGIGPDDYGGGCGNITIEGGTIFATGGNKEAGIGGSFSGNITITDGVTSVTSTAGTGAPYSIGTGRGTLTIGGVVTDNFTQNPFTYTPSETNETYTITYNANGGEGTIDPQVVSMNTLQTLTANSFTRQEYIFLGWNTEANGSGTKYTDGQCVMNIGNVTLYAQWSSSSARVLGENTATCVFGNGSIVTGTGGSDTHISIAAGATVTLSNVDITNIPNDSRHTWAGISCKGDATIILDGYNVVMGGHQSAGIYIPTGYTLTIQGDGILTATGGSGRSAGIGSNKDTGCGNIVIEGGTITATGKINAAGIGSVYKNTCGDITITGGTVTASGGNTAAGIGSGQYGTCGNITIAGGTVTSTGGNFGAGIGCGQNGTCGDITILGGTVTSTPGSYAAGIGCGGDGKCGKITITGDMTRVIATKIDRYVDIIGSSSTGSKCGAVTIDPSLIDVTSDDDLTLNIYPGLMLHNTDDNTSAIAAADDGATHDILLRGHTLYKDSYWNTLCLPFSIDNTGGTPLEGAIIKELDVTTSSLTDGLLTLNFKDATGIVAGKPYIVKWTLTEADFTVTTDAEWETLASNVNNGTEEYSGKLVRLGADINVSTMVGTSEHPFQGTFDGDGHTLTLSLSDTENQGTAPFRYISDATIMNVKTTGTVTGNLHCAGLVGFAKGGTNIIKNCNVAASVICSGGDHSHCGGIVGHSLSSDITISDCLFSGSISGATTATGIIHGWSDQGTLTILNCYANGSYSDGSIDLIEGNGTYKDYNCYKNASIGISGKRTYATGDALVALLGSGWKNDGGNVVPKKYVEKINNPVFLNVTFDANAETSVNYGVGQFVGTYSPLASTSGMLLDDHNPDNGAFCAALSITSEPTLEGYTFGGWYTDIRYTVPVSSIPFADDGTVRLYAKWTRNTVVLTALNSGSSVAELESNWAGKTVDVSFTRTFTQDVASTICLPYPMTEIPSGGSVYEFVDVQKEAGVWVATMRDATPGNSGNEVTETVAGKPYLFMPSSTGEVTFTGTVEVPDNVTAGTSTSSANDGTWTFRGTYRRLAYKADGSADLDGSVFGFASATKKVDGKDVNAGEFVKAKDGAGVPAFRAYLTYDGTNNVFRAPMRGGADDTSPDIPDRITVRLLGKGGIVTAVGTMDTSTGDVKIEQWFDMQGRPVNGTPTQSGMYFNNIGSKIMIQ